MRSVIILCLACLSMTLQAQQIKIIPEPFEIKMGKGSFFIGQKIQISYDVKTKNAAEFLANYLGEHYGINSQLSANVQREKSILLAYSSVNKEGSYSLKVDNNGVTISGDAEGVFYGVQTLVQMLPAQISDSRLSLPYVQINDYPRFPYRGMHLDVGRHFFPISFIKKYIDYLALHKMNYFHWHLTEDQGWRIEIKKYPRLTQVGAWRNGTIIGRFPGIGNDGIRYGGFYTQDEIRDVVAYAAKRFITVIPEIEMPGHCSAAIASYPWLSCFPNESTKHPPQSAWSGDTAGKQVQQTWGVFEDVYCAGKDSTFQFLEDVLDEVMALFPSKYIHVGGDECPKANWMRCPLCQKRIRDEGLKDEHELQSYFIQRIEKYLNSKGRTLLGWDEILEGGLAPNAVVMSWRGEVGGIAAARQKHNVIMTPDGWVYLDHSQSENEDSVTIGGYIPVEKVYGYEPVSDSLTMEQAKYILGAQGNVWTEYMMNESKVEYMIFPRMSALSEVLWSNKKNWKNFEQKLPGQFKRYDLWKANYSRAYLDLKATVLPASNFSGILWKLETKTKGDTILFHNYAAQDSGCIDSKHKTPTDTICVACFQRTPFIKKINCTGTYGYNLIRKDVDAKLITQKFWLNKATGRKISLILPSSSKYPGDGGFTLVNGVQNEKGLARSREFLGFNGTDCEALIDLGSFQQISNVKVHVFEQTPSWIWRPKFFQVLISPDNKIYTEMGITDVIKFNENNRNATMTIYQKSVGARFIKIKLGNFGPIPEGNPGAGSKPWLFADEIEVN